MSDAKLALPIPERLVTRNLSKTKMTRDPRAETFTLAGTPGCRWSLVLEVPPFQEALHMIPGRPRVSSFRLANREKVSTPSERHWTGPGIEPRFADFDQLAKRKS